NHVVIISGRGLPYQEWVQLTKRVQKDGEKCVRNVRIGTLNVGSLTGKGRELVDLMERRKIQILCVQETRWKGDKAKVLAEGYKLFYSGADHRGRNGVGIIVDKELKEEVCEVERINDRIMSMKLAIGKSLSRVICVYAPQVGCDDSEKEEFWKNLDEVVMRVPENEKMYLCGDLNGHVGGRENDEESVHGGWAFGERNEEGGMIVEHARAFDLKILNTCFQKEDRHLITYKSGGNESQIDYILCRRKHHKEIRNCKVINGESITSQHRLLVVDVTVKEEVKVKHRRKYEQKIKWWRLKEENLRRQFKEKILTDIRVEEDVDVWWTVNSEVIRKTGEEILGKTSGKGVPEDKEVWWWNSEVQEVVRTKKIKKRNWDLSGREQDKEEYLRAKKDAKRAVAQAKARAIDEGYKEIENNEGERKLLRIAKARDRASKDVTVIKQVKDNEGRVLQEHDQIRDRWKQYFENLLNEENPREIFENGEANEG
ncbi:craniofacial development protein 2-like, partial [Diaphorina citri]|uniref:Craniofacial development protein 2-like n=1 Tax=Diaphorina citri TaxID=121845 RepID=A0A1S3DQ07_DIACI